MRTCTAALLFTTFLLLAGCSTTPSTTMATPASRVYHGTASVGDFMTITINSSAQTIAYTDVSNNTSGTVPYTVNSNGMYTLNDPTGNLIAAYEVPNYAMVIQAAKTGPSANTPALITAVESGTISLATFEGQTYNYMQFRTSVGGVSVGGVSIGTSGTGTTSSYWPYGALNADNNSAFSSNTLEMATAQLDPSGTFLTISDPGGNGSSDYVFGTANGIFAVDTPNGAILGLKTAASPNFDPSVAGTYNGIYYKKINASMAGQSEQGTVSQGTATLVVTSGGQVTITDAQGATMAQGMLTPVSSVSTLYGANELEYSCNGLFTFQTTSNNTQQQVFVAFMGQAVLFSSFKANLPWGSGGNYNYFYGVGLE